MRRAEEERPDVTLVTVCRKTPMQAHRLAGPLGEAVVRNGLVGLLEECRSRRLRVEVYRSPMSASAVQVVVHWHCCYSDLQGR